MHTSMWLRDALDVQEALFASGVVVALVSACSSGAATRLRSRAVRALGNAALDVGEGTRAMAFLQAVPLRLVAELCSDADALVRVRV